MLSDKNKALNAQRMELYNQGLTDAEIADATDAEYVNVKMWRSRRGLKPNKQTGVRSNMPKQYKIIERKQCLMQKPNDSDKEMFCKLTDKEIQANIASLVASYGIKSSLVVRKASETEITSIFASIKPISLENYRNTYFPMTNSVYA